MQENLCNLELGHALYSLQWPPGQFSNIVKVEIVLVLKFFSIKVTKYVIMLYLSCDSLVLFLMFHK